MKSWRNQRSPALLPATLLLLALCAAPAAAVDFAGGTGEPNDPYQIATVEQLLVMDDDPNLYNKHFALTTDLDLDPALPGGKIFAGAVLNWPVRRSRSAGLFQGSFEGNGHAIRHVVLYNANSSLHVGLWGSVGASGSIRNVHLEDILILDTGESGGYCGALAGENDGLIANCSATGTIAANSTGYESLPGAGLIGRNAGIVVNCYAQCYVFGGRVGGLVGENSETGRVLHCSSEGSAYGDWMAGGLVGINLGSVQYVSAHGMVFGDSAGGLIGENEGTVRASYITGDVSGDRSVGGIAANNAGYVIDCYVTGSVQGDGLVGINQGTLASSYSTTAAQVASQTRRTRYSPGVESIPPGAKAALEPLGSIRDMAVAMAPRRVRHIYYLDPNKTEDPPDSSYASDYGIPLWPAEMERQASFVGFDFYGDPNDGGQDHWFMPASGYPLLTWQTDVTSLCGIPEVSGLDPETVRELLTWTGFVPGAISYDHARAQEVCDWWDCQWVSTEGQALYTHPGTYAAPGSSVEIVVSLGPYDFDDNPGDGSESNPYQIETPGQLDSLYDQEHLWDRHFVLTTDIDLTGQTYSRALIEYFSGTFDGSGHTIRGFHLDTQSWRENRCGLFGTVDSRAIVHDLRLAQARLEIDSDDEVVGILAGANDGQIFRCTAQGQVLGGAYAIGGLVGENTRSIFACSVTDVTISARDYVGGLAGISHGGAAFIEACYARGTVAGRYVVGGLLGANGLRRGRGFFPVINSGTVRHCYAACAVTAQEAAGGGLGGGVSETKCEGSYFLDPNDGGGLDNGYGTALSAEEMRRQASFGGWDFESTWTMSEGLDYPHLQWENVDDGTRESHVSN